MPRHELPGSGLQSNDTGQTSARQIYQAEGLASLLRRGVRFLAYCLFEHRSYWLYTERVASEPHLDEADFMPRINGFTFKIVTSNQEADEMEAQGLEFRSHVPNGRERLDKGAVAFCAFADRELIGISWVAMSRAAKDTLPEPPFKVDFCKGEACIADGWTSPKYRRKGLSMHRAFRARQFLLERGIALERNAFRKGTDWPDKLAARFGRTRYGEGRYLRILWWKSWGEKPLPPESQSP